MGTQSSRMIYRGKDIKDFFYRGNYLNKLYKANSLVWEKLYRFFLNNSTSEIFDLDSKVYLDTSNNKYTIGTPKMNISNGISTCRDNETKEYFIAITEDCLKWKKIKGIDFLKNGGSISNIIFSSTGDGFFVYCVGHNESPKKENEIYLITIDFGLEYEVKKIYSSNIWFRYPQGNGISESFYGIQYDKPYQYILHKIKKNGEVTSKQLKGPFVTNNVNIDAEGIHVLANDNENVYMFCPFANARNGGTYVFHVSEMETEDVYISFFGGSSKFLEGARCGIEIIYDSYQTLFAVHNEKYEVGNLKYVDTNSYKKTEFYIINALGQTMLAVQKDGTEDMHIKCIGLNNVNVLGIRFRRKGKEAYQNPEIDGFIYFADIKKGISSKSNGTTKLSLEIKYGKEKNDKCFIGTYSWGTFGNMKSMVIYIDNLFWNESDNNFAVVV